MKDVGIKDYDDLDLIEKRIAYLLGARVRDKNRIKNAIMKQDQMRKKHLYNKDWDSVIQIRKWRDWR